VGEMNDIPDGTKVVCRECGYVIRDGYVWNGPVSRGLCAACEYLLGDESDFDNQEPADPADDLDEE